MKKVNVILILNLCFLFLVNHAVLNAQNGVVWKFQTKGMITSSPVIADGKVYFGSDDSCLYCRNALTGDSVWSYKTNTPILSIPVISKGMIFFESGNNLYALNAESGNEIWKFVPEFDTLAGKIDPWDYHHSSPFVDDTMVYYGCGNGKVYGLAIAGGTVAAQYSTVNNSAVRSTPSVKGGILYFGDWHSRLYAFNLKANDTLWTIIETSNPLPYATFGAFVTGFTFYNDLLFAGARNNTVRAVDIKTGNDVWSIYDNSGSWMPGDPVIYDTILYIGGSDNKSFWALNANTGEKIWTYLAGQNIFSKPIVCKNYIFFTSGNGGTYDLPNPNSSGYLHLINRSTGTLVNKFRVNGSIFSSPVISDGIIYFGSNDSTLYAIDSAYLFRPIPYLSFPTQKSVLLGKIYRDTTVNIILRNKGDIADTLLIDVTCNKTITKSIYNISDETIIIGALDSCTLQVTIHPKNLAPDNYELKVSFNSHEINWLDLSKKIIFNIPIATFK